MKKTLFLLSSMALAAASAQAATLCNTTFTRAGTSLDSVKVNSQSDYDLIVVDSISNFNRGGNPANGQNGDLLGNGDIPSTVVTPNSNVSLGGSWSMTFTFTNTGSQAMTISSIDLSLIGVTGGGGAQNTNNGCAIPAGQTWVGGATGTANKPIDLTLRIIGVDAQTLTYNCASGGVNAGDWTEGLRTGSYNFMEGFKLGVNESLTITIEAAKNDLYNKGCFAGLTGIQINGDLVVPEPATASLGLLGLAALLMRRRRA